MKNLKRLGASGLVIILLVAFGIYHLKNNDSLKVIQSKFNYDVSETVDELANKAQLVVIASTSQKFEDRQAVTKFMPNGAMNDFYTLTNIQLKKILKQPTDFKLDEKNIMTIIEPVVLLEDKAGKRILTGESYSPLVENDNYILFLAANTNGTYCIINGYRGKFNLTKAENTYNPLVPYIEDHKSKYIDMKREVAKKYLLKIKEKS